MDLLERSESLDALFRLAAEAATGSGRLALIGGEAGVGKTALIRHFSRAVSREIRVVCGSCDPLSLPRPLGPLLDMAPQLGGGVRRLIAEEAPAARLFSALLELLTASPHVLVFEDMHWADDGSLDLLRYLGRRLASTRSLVIATYRDDETGPRHPLQIALGDLATSQASCRLQLRALTIDAVATLAAGSGVDVAALHRTTGGNPFFVIEMLGAAGTALPATLRDAVLARAARLTPAGRRALDGAAVLGSRFPPALLAAIGLADAAVDECLSGGALVRDGDMVAFRHELSRAAILDALLPARAIELHRLALAAWRLLSPTADALAALAHHADAAGDGAAVLEFAPRAARRASELRSHREAAEQYARTLRWAHQLAPREQAVLYEERSYQCYLTGQMEAALEARRHAIDRWRADGEIARVGDNLRWQSRLSWWLGRRADAEAQSRESIAVLESAGPGPQLAWAFAHASQIAMLASRRPEAIAWGMRAIELAEHLGEREVLCHALNNLGTARYDLDGGPEGVRELERSLALAFELGHEVHVARAYANLSAVSVSVRRLDAAETYLRAGLAYCEEHDFHLMGSYLLGFQATCRFWRGDYADAARNAEALLREPLPRSDGSSRSWSSAASTRGAAIRERRRCSTRHGRSPPAPASCSGWVRSRRRGRRRHGSPAIGRPRPGPRARPSISPSTATIDGRSASWASGCGAPARSPRVRAARPSRTPATAAARRGRRRPAGRRSGRPTRPRTPSPTAAARTRCARPIGRSSGWARSRWPIASPAGFAPPAPAAPRDVRAPLPAPTPPG